MRSTQGMHESQPITSFRRKWARVVRCGRLFPSPFTGAVHNRRHSGERRIPEGKGNGEAPAYPPSFLQIINAIPHIINVIPRIVNVIPAHHQRHSRGRGNPEKTNHAVVHHCAGKPVVFVCPWIPASAGMTAGYVRV